jgi:hypothetical protein
MIDTFRRSTLPPSLRNAPSELIVDFHQIAMLAYSYEAYPPSAHPKLTRKKRIAFARSIPITIVDDVPIVAQPAEPREAMVGDDARYGHPLAIRRSSLPTIWQNAPTSLVVDYIRMLKLAQSYDEYPPNDHPEFDWSSRQAYAGQMPIEIYDDLSDGMPRVSLDLDKQEQSNRDDLKRRFLEMALKDNRDRFARKWSN